MKGNSNSKKTTEEKKNEISVSRKNDLLSLLPIEVQQSKELTINHKLVLGYLIEFNNIDKAKDNGYIYRTNDIISQETGVCLNTLRSSFTKLTDLGFIERTAGHRGKASEYRLHMTTIKSYGSKTKSYGSKTKSYGSKFEDEDCTNKLNPKSENCTNKLNPKSDDLLLIINELRNDVKSYRSKVEEYKNEVEGYKMKLNSIFENCTTDTDIDKETDTISKDNLLDNDNTEGRNSKEKNNIKEKSTKDNLEILKENSNDEIFNDEDIQRENESLDEDKDNISKVKSSNDENLNESRIPSESRIETRDNISTDNISNNENLNESRISDLVDMYFNQTNIPNDNIPSESRIPSEDNISTDENPNDMPPLDVDCFFEDSNSTEYRNNENLNEENENSKEDENPSKANGSSNEDGGLNEDKNPSDENPSKANENPEDDEMDCSVFGDSNSTDEDNDKWYESSRSSKSDNHANGMFTNLISELTSNENPKTNEISNDNNLKTSENMKKTNNKTNTIQSEGKNPSDEKTLKNLNAFGKLQSFRDLNTGRIDGYQFNSYDNLNDSRDYSKSFHASVLCLNLEPSDLKKVSVSDTGVWGILNRTNGVYSFIPSNVGPSYAPNNAPQASKNAEVDNHTTEGEKVDSTQSQIANKASESNNDTAADSKEDEKATETVYADENTDKVDNHTTDEEITAGNSVKMRPEPSDSNTNTTDTPNNALQASKTSEVGSNTTNTEKVAPEQSQIANKASNAGVLDGLDGKTKAMIEELMKRDAAKNVTPMGRDYFKGAPDRWKEIHLKCAYAGGNNGDLLTIEEAIENYSSYESPRLHLDAIRTYAEEICKRMRNVLADNVITQEQFNAFSDVFKFKSEGYKAACAEEFKKNKPTTESEKWMYNWIYKKNKKNVKN